MKPTPAPATRRTLRAPAVRGFISFGLALAAAPLGACSSASAPSAAPPSTSSCKTCVDGGVSYATGQNSNPDGVPYPTAPGGYGHLARRGKVPGSIIENFKFLGYRYGNSASGLQPIALSEYFDPCNKRLKLLHLSVAAVWCVPCQMETAAFVASKDKLASDQVVVVQALSDGPTRNVGATQSDLDFWIQTNHSSFTSVLDPNLANLGTFFDAAAVPWNSDIDPRTMEILVARTGWAGTVDLELSAGVAAVGQAPAYPLATACP